MVTNHNPMEGLNSPDLNPQASLFGLFNFSTSDWKDARACTPDTANCLPKVITNFDTTTDGKSATQPPTEQEAMRLGTKFQNLLEQSGVSGKDLANAMEVFNKAIRNPGQAQGPGLERLDKNNGDPPTEQEIHRRAEKFKTILEKEGVTGQALTDMMQAFDKQFRTPKPIDRVETEKNADRKPSEEEAKKLSDKMEKYLKASGLPENSVSDLMNAFNRELRNPASSKNQDNNSEGFFSRLKRTVANQGRNNNSDSTRPDRDDRQIDLFQEQVIQNPESTAKNILNKIFEEMNNNPNPKDDTFWNRIKTLLEGKSEHGKVPNGDAPLTLDPELQELMTRWNLRRLANALPDTPTFAPIKAIIGAAKNPPPTQIPKRG
ncbi:MAG: hypothetical protein K2X93_27755 [Candidatus Obscuribacterales bacterium]|nr:hypothetical protein [Candidatus Obscuribacterales bacterium]